MVDIDLDKVFRENSFEMIHSGLNTCPKDARVRYKAINTTAFTKNGVNLIPSVFIREF